MKTRLILVLTVLLTVITFSNSFAISLNPGNYEIKNWIELPGGGSSNSERRIDYIDGTEKELSKLYTESGCEVLSKRITGNTLNYELKCNFSGVEIISGSFKFMGDSFEGVLLYKTTKGEMKVGMRGKRIGDTPESKPKPTSAKQLDEIDKELRRKWNIMNSYVNSGNFDKALEFFHPLKRNDRSQIFQALKGKWPEIVAEQIELKRVRIDDEEGYAIYELVTNEKDGKHSYEVNFGKDPQNDIWYIMDY